MKWALALMVSVPFIYSCEGNAPQVKPEIAVRVNTVEATGGDQFMSVTASGNWSIAVKDQSGGPLSWVSVKPSSGYGSMSNVILTVEKNNGESARTAILELTADGNRTTVALTQQGMKESGGSEDVVVPEGCPDLRKVGWLEIPGIPEGTKLGQFSHSMTIGPVKTRNYSYSWDYTNFVAPWVAYPLCRWNIGSGNRTNAWGVDPYLSEKQQPVLYMRGFRSTSSRHYDRGHQLPSADRLHNGANQATFYGTNMTPQLSELNQHFWANLEGKVRSWAGSSDTCYVVTGCLTELSTEYALDNVGKKITVPSHYYKAVLRYSKSTTLGFAGYMGCAILLEHRDYGNGSNFKEYAISIDELEKKTGIDFYPNLSKLIGKEAAAKVEAQDPKTISWWW